MTAQADTPEPDRRFARRRHARVLAWCLAASVAGHVALIAGLPSFVTETTPIAVEVLEVVLVRPEPPPPLPATAPERTTERRPVAASRDKPPRPPPRAEMPVPPRKDSRPRIPETGARAPDLARAPEPPAAPVSPNVPQPTPPPAAPVAPAGSAASKSKPAAAPPTQPVAPPSFNAAYLENPPPRYPPIARRRGEEGTVTLRVHVRRDGVPAAVALEKSSGSEALDAAALDAVRGWRFTPARRGEERVDAWVLVPIVFRLEGAS